MARRNISFLSSHTVLVQSWKVHDKILCEFIQWVYHTETALLSSPVKNANSDSLGCLKIILWIIDDNVGVVCEVNKETDKMSTK